MKLTVSQLRTIIVEELREAASKEPIRYAPIGSSPDGLAFLDDLSSKTRMSISNGKDAYTGEFLPEVPNAPAGTMYAEPFVVSYSGETPKAPRVEIAWESWDQYMAARGILRQHPKPKQTTRSAADLERRYRIAIGMIPKR